MPSRPSHRHTKSSHSTRSIISTTSSTKSGGIHISLTPLPSTPPAPARSKPEPNPKPRRTRTVLPATPPTTTTKPRTRTRTILPPDAIKTTNNPQKTSRALTRYSNTDPSTKDFRKDPTYYLSGLTREQHSDLRLDYIAPRSNETSLSSYNERNSKLRLEGKIERKMLSYPVPLNPHAELHGRDVARYGDEDYQVIRRGGGGGGAGERYVDQWDKSAREILGENGFKGRGEDFIRFHGLENGDREEAREVLDEYARVGVEGRAAWVESRGRGGDGGGKWVVDNDDMIEPDDDCGDYIGGAERGEGRWGDYGESYGRNSYGGGGGGRGYARDRYDDSYDEDEDSCGDDSCFDDGYGGWDGPSDWRDFDGAEHGSATVGCCAVYECGSQTGSEGFFGPVGLADGMAAYDEGPYAHDAYADGGQADSGCANDGYYDDEPADDGYFDDEYADDWISDGGFDDYDDDGYDDY